jgi:hypothetical protein
LAHCVIKDPGVVRLELQGSGELFGCAFLFPLIEEQQTPADDWSGSSRGQALGLIKVREGRNAIT